MTEQTPGRLSIWEAMPEGEMEPDDVEQQIEQEVAHERARAREAQAFPPWEIGTVLFLTALYMAIPWILNGFAEGIIRNPNHAHYVVPRLKFILSLSMLVVIGVATLSFFFITYSVVRSHHLSLSHIGFSTRDTLSHLPGAILIGCCTGLFFTLWAIWVGEKSSPDLIKSLWEKLVNKQFVITLEAVAKDDLLIMILYIGVQSILIPLGEETFFRGFAYPAFTKRFSIPVAIFLSSLLFLIAHGHIYSEPLISVPIFIAGILLTLFYERTGLLPLCMLIHGLINLIPKLFIWL